MVAITPWTLEQLHRLPDDGNTYELVRGELFVTPAPTEDHEIIANRLHEVLAPYVKQHDLGMIFRPRAVFRRKGSEVEPDLMVRRPRKRGARGWAGAPLPVLVVEILSPTTGRRDRNQKRSFYMEEGIPEYWIIDPEQKTITRVRTAASDETFSDRLLWAPAGAPEALAVDVAEVFA